MEQATLLEMRLWRRCFLVDFAKYLKIPFLQNTFGRLFLFTPTSPSSSTHFFPNTPIIKDKRVYNEFLWKSSCTDSLLSLLVSIY